MAEKKYSGWKFWLTITLLVVVPGTESCDDNQRKRIAIPVCTCVVRGAEWTRDKNQKQDYPKPDGEDAYYVHNGNTAMTNLVLELITETNEVWIPGADIALLELYNDGDIPVIDDPDPASGKYGEIVGHGPAGSEAADAASQCRAAWREVLSSFPDVLVIVIARNIIYSNGSSSPKSGISEDYGRVLQRNNGNDLCNLPRNLTKEDTKGRYIIIDDPWQYMNGDSKGNGLPHIILAHELGHVLMLGHGDGLDNDVKW